jgi:hypothetical protein
MKNMLFSLLLFTVLHAETNTTTASANKHQEPNATTTRQKSAADTNLSKKALLQKEVAAQMEREKKYAKEQKFYQGKDYNLTEHEVDPKTLKDVPVINPDYDFDITDVYRDDI